MSRKTKKQQQPEPEQQLPTTVEEVSQLRDDEVYFFPLFLKTECETIIQQISIYGDRPGLIIVDNFDQIEVIDRYIEDHKKPNSKPNITAIPSFKLEQEEVIEELKGKVFSWAVIYSSEYRTSLDFVKARIKV